MSHTVEREKLLNALESISSGLSSRSPMDQANCFVFKDGYIYSYNDEVACRVKSPMDIKGAIEADRFKAILHNLRETELQFKDKKGRVYFHGRKKRLWITKEREISLPVEDLDYPKKNQWKDLPSSFSEGIKFVQGCASKDDSKKDLTCIHLANKHVEAFDNYQMARYRMKLPLDQEVNVKQIALRHIASMVMTEFFETDNWIHFRDANKQIFSCRVYLEEYRNLDDIVAVSGTKITLPKGLGVAAKQAGIFATDSQNPNENYITVTLKKGKATVEGEGQFGGIEIDSPIKSYVGKKFSFKILPNILEQLVKEHSECELNEKAMKAQSGRALFVTSLVPPKEGK